MRRFRPGGKSNPNAVADLPSAPPGDWRGQALAAAGLWLRVDGGLRVTEASDAARDFFAPPSLPSSLVVVTRSAALESFARQGLAGETGPWDVDTAHFKRVFRVRVIVLADGGAVVFLDDVTELHRLQAMRADFVANLAHELRTPVASLSLAAETLSTELPVHEQRRFIARITEETRYIEGLLKSVSELALLESKVNLTLSEFDLHAVVEETWRRVTDRQGPSSLTNDVRVDFTVVADRVRVAEILQNLLENAHRFSPEGHDVEVRAWARGGMIEIGVRDHGPGIPPADLPRVFERFYKVDRARTRRGDGSGLGLAITKHLVSAHGGTVMAQAADGGGTVVTVRLPIPPVAPASLTHI